MVDEKYAWNGDLWGIMAVTMSWIWPREYVMKAGTGLSSSLKTCLACIYVHHMQILIHSLARICKLTNKLEIILYFKYLFQKTIKNPNFAENK